jgi:GDPmannose 4,6-dehydratase
VIYIEFFLEGYICEAKTFVCCVCRYFRPAEVDSLKGDSTKARHALNWKPKVGFQDLVKMMVNTDLEIAKKEKVLVDAGYHDPQQQP